MRDHINARIKFREDFRPFAPSVPEEDVGEYFEDLAASPYMILVARAREAWAARIPAVVHRDGSCRVQTVSEKTDPVYHRLLREFGKLTGCSVLLNTSLNRRGMPIVETPEQAIDLFLETALDALVLEDCIVTDKPEAWRPPINVDAIVRLLSSSDHLDSEGAAPASGTVDLVLDGLRLTWSLDCGSGKLSSGPSPHPDTTIELDARQLEQLLCAREDAKDMLAAGRVKVLGGSENATSEYRQATAARVKSLLDRLQRRLLAPRRLS